MPSTHSHIATLRTNRELFWSTRTDATPDALAAFGKFACTALVQSLMCNRIGPGLVHAHPIVNAVGTSQDTCRVGEAFPVEDAMQAPFGQRPVRTNSPFELDTHRVGAH